MKLYNVLKNNSREIVGGLLGIAATASIVAGLGLLSKNAEEYTLQRIQNYLATPTMSASYTPTLEDTIEPTATVEPTLTATPTATPTPVEYGEGITRIEMLVAQNINPSVINLSGYNIDSRTQFKRVLKKNDVCIVPYLVNDGEIEHAIGKPEVLDELDVLRVDIDESLVPTSYGNHIQIVYDVGHMENDVCVSGINENPVMELSVALAYQNGSFKNSLLHGIEAINWPEKNTIAPVHEVDLNYQQYQTDLKICSL